MNEKEQRVAIATACGWCNIGLYDDPMEGIKVSTNSAMIPDYLNDLNAMHEAEKFLSDSDKSAYWHQLNEQVQGTLNIAFATAAQRAEAFLKTLNLWTK